MQSASTNITTFPGKVGISNANPTHTLAIGSNVYVDDTGSNKLTVTGVISGDGLGISNIQTVNVLGLTDNVTRIGTLETDLDNNSSRISTVSTDLSDNSSRISTVSTDLSDNSSRISTVSTDLSDNSSRISTVSTDLSDNSSRITSLESGASSISGVKTFEDDIILESNLRVNGSLTYANTVNMIVSDPIIELGANNQHTNDLGLVLTRHGNLGNDSNVAIFYDESQDTLKIGYTDNSASETTLTTTATGLDVSITGNVAAAYDTDTTSYFGRAAVGYMGQSDQASFSHLDKNTSANFALKQAASGATHLNTPTGQHIRFSVNATEVGRFTGGGDFEVGTSASTKKLIVDTSASEVQMYSQATGSTAGPDLVLMRDNPNNGANNEYIGQIRYEGLNDNGNSLLYAKTTGKIKTATNGSEDGVIETMIKTGGSNRISVRHSGAKFLIQKGTDLQVGEVANLYVDTSTSRVGINVASPSYTLDVGGDVNLSTGSTLRINGIPAVFSNWTANGSDIYRSSGNVGIGTDSPAYTLDVHGSSNVGALTATSAFQAGAPVSVRWDYSDSTPFPQNPVSAKYYKVASLGKTSSNSSAGRIRISGTIGGYTTGTTSLIDCYVSSRGGVEYGGSLIGKGISFNSTPCDILVYKQTDDTYDVYLKTDNYFTFDLTISGAILDTYLTKVVYPCPTTDTSVATPVGILEGSVVDACSFVMTDAGNVGIGTTNPGSLLTFYKDYTVPANGSEPADDTTQGITFRSDLNSFGASLSPAWSNSTNVVDTAKIWFQPKSYQGISGSAGVHGYLAFGTGYFGSQSNTPDMVINTGGNVGIGTTDPGGKLDVVASTEGDYIARFKNSSVASDEDARIVIEASDAAGESQILLQTTDESTTHKWNIVAGSGITPSLGFQYDCSFNGGTWAMNILHGGNVGIGTASPGTKLHINNTDDSTGTGDAFISGLSSNSSNRKPTECLRLQGQWRSPGSGALLRFTNYHASGSNPNTSEYNTAGIAGFDYSNQWGGGLCLYTAPNTSGGGDLIPRMVIDSPGNVGIGTTSPDQKLEVHGNILLGKNDVSSFIHGGSQTAMSSDADILIVADSNDTSGAAPAGDIIFGSGSAINMNSAGNRSFTFAEAFPDAVPRNEHMRITGDGNVGIGTTGPIARLDIDGGAENNTTPALAIRGGLYDTSDLYVLNTYSVSTGVGYAAKVIGVNIKNKVETDNTVQIRNNVGGLTSAGAIYIGSDDTTNQGIFGVLGGDGAAGTTLAELLTVKGNGNVGIGVTNPGAKLDISATSGYTPAIRIGTNTTYSDDQLYSLAFGGSGLMGMGLYSSTRTVFGSQGLGIHIPVSEEFSIRTNSWAKLFALDGTEHTAFFGGELYIGRNGKDGGAMANSVGTGRKNLFIQSTFGGNTSQNYGWWIGAQNQSLGTSDNDLYFSVVRNGTLKLCGVMLDQNNSEMNFTGQHRTFVEGVPTQQLEDKEGLIVSADQNDFIRMSGGVARGNEAITTNESLPIVSFSTKSNDKKCFGVVSTTEDPENRVEIHGNFASNMRKELGDTRVYINSVGEGAVWVTDINGPLESGDYITTSNVAGYGMRQEDDILHNYTVAKITMDCDFNPVTQPVQIIKKELANVDYWIDYATSEIKQEEYETLPENEREIREDKYYKIYKREIQKTNPENDKFVHEVYEELVNVLDEHGQLQWEDDPSGTTEKAYKIRYLDTDGNITDEANAVHIAAFVGCTYHCG